MTPTSRLLAFAAFSLPLALHATDPTLDSAFVSTISPGVTPDGYPTFNSGTGAVNAVALQSDGKILVGGNISRYQAPPAGSPQSSLKRLNPDGTLDTVFGTLASTLADSQGDTEVNKILTVAGDKLYVGGVFTSYDGVARSGLMRLNADGSLDTGFNASGISNSNAFGMRYVLALAEQPDGKLLVGGGYNRANGTFRPGLARFNPEGILDTSFDPSPALPIDTAIHDIAVLPNGQILAAGGKPRAGGGYVPLLVRLNADGSLDSSLAPSFTDSFGDIDELLVLPDGRILIGGDFSLAPTGTSYYFAALLPDGTLDTAFMSNVGSGPNGWGGGELALQPDGTILVGGIFKRWNNQPRASIARLNPDGTLDGGLAVPPYVDDNSYLTHFYSFAVQPDGKLLAGGWFEHITDTAIETYNLTRFVNEYAPTEPGTLRFLATQVTTAENAASVTLQVSRFGGLSGPVSVDFATLSGGADGTATTGADFSTASGTLTWANGEGGFKTITVPVLQDTATEAAETFTIALSGVTGGAFLPTPASRATVTIRDDDSLPVITSQPASVSLEQGAAFSLSIRFDSVLAASVQWQRDPDGEGPLTFTDIPGATSTMYTVATADLATHAGTYRAVVTNPNGSTPSNNAAVSISVPAGSLITTFAPPATTPIVLTAQGMSVDSAGRYLMLSNTGLRRLNTDGTLDPTTSFGISVSGATCVLGLDDGRILIAGNLSIPYTHQPSGATSTVNSRIFRLNADTTGTIDTSWSVSTNGIVTALAPGAGGKFYVGSGAAPTSTNGIQRFLASGATDASFTPVVNTIAAGTGATVVFIKELADGKILVSHRHGSTSTGTYRLSRLTSTGALDTTFGTAGSIDFGTSNWVNGLDVLPDGRIAVSGRFNTDFFTAGQRYLAILNTNGTLDTSFQFGSTVLNGNPNGVLYRDGRLFVWGAFTTVNGNPQGGVMRVNLDGSIDSSFSAGVGIAGGAASVNAARFTSTGEIFITGGFTSYKGVARNYSALLVGNPQIGAVGFTPPRVTTIESSTSLALTVRRYGPATEAVSIAYATADGTALAGTDYTATSGTVSWTAGDSADKTVFIPLINDATVEVSKTFRIVLGTATGPVNPAASATVTLLDDDTPVSFTTSPAALTNLNIGGSLSLTSATTSPTPTTYQWFLNGVAISGASTASYAKNPVTAPHAGLYTLVATNAAGSFTSSAALVVISPQPGNAVNGQVTSGRPTFSSQPTTLVSLPDGGALVGGYFTQNTASNVPQSYLIRIRPDGSTDTSFTLTLNGSVTALLVQPDGKILVGGTFTTVNGSASKSIARLNADLTLDTAFSTAVASTITNGGSLTDLAFDSTGRVYLGFNNNNSGSVARVSSAGVRDAAYTVATSTVSVGAGVTALAILPDDRLLVGGNFTHINSVSKNRLGRLATDGTVDTTFSPSLGTTPINDILVTPAGRIFLAGGSGGSNPNLFEINPDGSASIFSFGSGNQSYEIALGTDGRLAIARASSAGSGSISRINPPATTGGIPSADSTFVVGTGPNADVTTLAYNSDGSLWIAGQFTTFNGFASGGVIKLIASLADPLIVNPPVRTGVNIGSTARLSVGAVGTGLTYQWFKNGAPLADDARISGATTAILTITAAVLADDADYSVSVTGGTPSTTVTSSAGHIYVLGAPVVAAPPATVDMFAGPALTFSAEVFAAAPATYLWARDGVPVVNDARISGATTAALAFSSTLAADTGTYTLTVTNAQGTATSSVFVLVRPVPTERAAAFSGLSSSQSVTALHALPDGGMLVATLNGALTNQSLTDLTSGLHIVKPDGTVANLGIDPALGSALPFLSGLQVTALLRQPDGKILVGGAGGYLGRYHADGSLDTSFATGNGSTGGQVVHTLAFDDAGRLLVGGNFLNYKGVTGQNLLVRLDAATGALDTSFNAGFSSGSVTRILKLPGANSGFIVGGINIANPYTVYIRRYDASGANVASFTGQSYAVNTLALSPDGTAFYAAIQAPPYLVRYRVSDGSLDPAFTVPTGTFNNQINSLVVQPNGKVVAHGQFNIYPQTQIGRVLTNGAPDPTFLVGGTNYNYTYFPLALDSAGRIWLGGVFTNFNNATANRIAVLEGDVPALAWIAQPLPRSVAAGQTISFTVATRATSPVTYQWFKDGQPLTNGGRVSGATSASLLISSATFADEGFYTVRATNADATTIESSPAELVFLAAPEITSMPAGRTTSAGAAFTAPASARGAGTLSYQWLRAGVPVSGQTTAVLSLPAPATTDTGWYQLRVTNTLGTATSAPVLFIFAQYAGSPAGGIALPSMSNTINSLASLAGGGASLAGSFIEVTAPGGTAQNSPGVARLTTTGALFAPAPKVHSFYSFYGTQYSGTAIATVRDSQGRIIVAGNFDGVSSGATSAIRNSLARFNADGTLDTTWNSPLTAAASTITCLAVDASDNIYAGGSFSNFAGITGATRVVRLSASTGAVDSTFLASTVLTSGTINAILPRPDGRVLVGGTVSAYLLESNATASAGFTYAGGNNVVSLAAHPAGGYLVGRTTTLVRISDTGALVTPFPATGTATNGAVRAILPISGDRFVIAGGFTTYNNVTVGRIALINADGTANSSINFGTGFTDGVVNALALDTQNRLWVGGSFTTYNSTTVGRLAVLATSDFTPETPPPPSTDLLADFLTDAGVPANLRGPNDDADNDGLDNLIEYALDLNPNGSGGAFTGTPPIAVKTPTQLSYTYRRVRNDVTYTVETSPTLIGGTWTSVGVTQGTPGPDGTTTASILITPGSGFLRLTVTR